MQKIIYTISFILSYLKFWGGSVPLEYLILSPEEMSNNTNVKFVTQYTNEEIKTIGTGTTTRKMIVQKPMFLCYIVRRDWVLKIKKHLLIGKKNFKEHDSVNNENVKLLNQIETMQSTVNNLKEEKEDRDDFLVRFEKLLGSGIYQEHVINIENIKRRERSNKISSLKGNVSTTSQ